MIIAFSFLLLAALMLWVIIFARGHWAPKLILILFVPAFCFAVWAALGSYKGYPVSADLPARSVVISDIVVEPNGKDQGRIYLWLVPVNPHASVLGYHPGDGEPRAYVIPYSRPMHEELDGLRGKKGTPVLERVKPNGRRGVKNGPKSKFHAYIIPPTVPPKGG